MVNIYTNNVDKTFIPSEPDEEQEEEVEDEVTDPELLIVPNLEDIVLIGATGKRYSSGQTVTDPEIYYDSNNNRMLKVTFEVKNSVGDIVKGAVVI